MPQFKTEFGSLKQFTKGHIEIINDQPMHYAFSNVFDVASKSAPYEKVAVAINLEYVIEAIRAEGASAWMGAAHDEFCIVMDGQVEVEFIKLEQPDLVGSPEQAGTVALHDEPAGKRMGKIVLQRGHQALLPKGAAYRFKAEAPSVMIQQTMAGALTVQKWAEICYR
ncbi:hydroxyquinol 1,2-dioxygenase [Pseudoduganella rivuli]|nr:hydroxyquinol 1,2-dioxygenase [Pseudoduganella rivuli]